MDTKIDHIMSKYQILVERGMSQNDVILHLNREGLSITESIKIVRTLYNLPLSQAKQVVTSHPVWETTVKDNEPFHEELENMLLNM